MEKWIKRNKYACSKNEFSLYLMKTDLSIISNLHYIPGLNNTIFHHFILVSSVSVTKYG